MSDLADTAKRATVKIVNAKGLHARAAAKLAKLAATLKAEITVTRNEVTVSARSIMGLMMLAAAKGAEIEICVQGQDAEQALAAVVALVAGGFGES